MLQQPAISNRLRIWVPIALQALRLGVPIADHKVAVSRSNARSLRLSAMAKSGRLTQM
jgi:hypothetical protein